MSAKATVFVVDDDSAIRGMLTVLLEQLDIDVECFESGEAFLAACRWLPRSCAIVDMSLPSLDGIQLQTELSKRSIPLPIIFLTGHGDIPMSVRAMKAGAVDFLSKPVSSAELLASVQAALSESEMLSQYMNKTQTARTLIAHLTGRERDVLFLAVEGLANKAIARKLGISHRTVEIHKARIMQRTGAENVLELAHLVEESQIEVRPARLVDHASIG